MLIEICKIAPTLAPYKIARDFFRYITPQIRKSRSVPFAPARIVFVLLGCLSYTKPQRQLDPNMAASSATVRCSGLWTSYVGDEDHNWSVKHVPPSYVCDVQSETHMCRYCWGSQCKGQVNCCLHTLFQLSNIYNIHGNSLEVDLKRNCCFCIPDL